MIGTAEERERVEVRFEDGRCRVCILDWSVVRFMLRVPRRTIPDDPVGIPKGFDDGRAPHPPASWPTRWTETPGVLIPAVGTNSSDPDDRMMTARSTKFSSSARCLAIHTFAAPAWHRSAPFTFHARGNVSDECRTSTGISSAFVREAAGTVTGKTFQAVIQIAAETVVRPPCDSGRDSLRRSRGH